MELNQLVFIPFISVDATNVLKSRMYQVREVESMAPNRTVFC